jgi:hypothetical protein
MTDIKAIQADEACNLVRKIADMPMPVSAFESLAAVTMAAIITKAKAICGELSTGAEDKNQITAEVCVYRECLVREYADISLEIRPGDTRETLLERADSSAAGDWTTAGSIGSEYGADEFDDENEIARLLEKVNTR